MQLSNNVTWTVLKTIAVSQGLPIQYQDEDHQYKIYIANGSILFSTFIWKATSTDAGIPASNAADLLDFETNFKPSANQKIIFPTILNNVGVQGDRLKVETLPSTAAGSEQLVVIKDPLNNNKALVDGSGRLLVSTQPPAAPENTTPVDVVIEGALGNNAHNNYFYNIPSGESLILQRFLVSGQGGANDGWFFSLYFDPNGAGNANSPIQASWVRISLIIIPETGGSNFFDVSSTPRVGDGTARIVIRRERAGAGGSKYSFAQFTGYLE